MVLTIIIAILLIYLAGYWASAFVWFLIKKDTLMIYTSAVSFAIIMYCSVIVLWAQTR